MVLSSTCDIICVLNYIVMPCIALHSQTLWLSYDINHIHEDKGMF